MPLPYHIPPSTYPVPLSRVSYTGVRDRVTGGRDNRTLEREYSAYGCGDASITSPDLYHVYLPSYTTHYHVSHT